MQHGFWGDRSIKAQENYVVHVAGGEGAEDTWLYTGDRWDSAPDRLKSHDLQYWQPLRFDDTKSPATIAQLTWADNFTMQVEL